MFAKSGHLPANSEAYAFEIKWDGVRALLHCNRGKISLVSRNLLDITHKYPELQSMGEILADQQVVLDGEIIATDGDGKPSFSRLQERMQLTAPADIERSMQRVPICYMIFDVLFLDGVSTMDMPYHERRQVLEQMELVGRNWQTPPYFTGEGGVLLEACVEQRLEGLIAKKLSSTYEPEKRSSDWLKVKVRPRQEFVIGGYMPGEGARKGQLGSLLVGYYPRRAKRNELTPLHYAGRVGTGFTETMLESLQGFLRPLKRPDSPFVDMDPSIKGAVYVDPLLVGEVEFAEWTHKKTLRQPSFKGLRTDKDPRAVVKEEE